MVMFMFVVECGPLPLVPYGYFRLLNPKKCYEGDHAILECQEGFLTDGKIDIECQQSNGVYSWEMNNGTCVLKSK